MSSNSVLRRYTPPTCTLEIAAKGSPLSRWMGRPALKQLSFQLSLDDPRLPEEKRIELRGDKTQLEALREAVEAYTQGFLSQSPDPSNGTRWRATSTDAIAPSEESSDRAFTQHSDSDTGSELEEIGHQPPSPTLDEDSTSTDSPAVDFADAQSETSPPTPLPVEAAGIYLQPDGLLTHNLFLGSLATEESGRFIPLSTLQLFDLATALEQYADDLVALPNLNRSNKQGFGNFLKTTPAWTKTAAAVVLAVGATAAAVKLLDKNTFNQKTAAPPVNPEATPTEQPPIAVAPSPMQTLVLPPASSGQLLPTPAPLGSPIPLTPGAIAPTPGVLPPPLGAPVPPTPGLSSPLGSTVPPTAGSSSSLRSTVPPTAGVFPSSRSTLSPSAKASPQTEYKIPVGSDSSVSLGTRQQNTSSAKPSPTQTAVQRNAATGATPRQERSVVTPTPNQNALASVPRRERQAATPTPNRRAITSTPTPYSFPRPEQAPKASAFPTQAPRPIPTPTFDTLPQLPESTTQVNIPTPAPILPAPANTADPSVAVRSAPVPATPETTSSPATEREGGNTFDPIPQVAEARKYFQQRWRPPSSLTQDIEYTLSLNPDGSVKNITPRGQTAEIYLDRTEMPLVGERFVSPIEGGRNTTIIVVLSKDGKVQTFLGPSN